MRKIVEIIERPEPDLAGAWVFQRANGLRTCTVSQGALEVRLRFLQGDRPPHPVVQQQEVVVQKEAWIAIGELARLEPFGIYRDGVLSGRLFGDAPKKILFRPTHLVDLDPIAPPPREVFDIESLGLLEAARMASPHCVDLSGSRAVAVSLGEVFRFYFASLAFLLEELVLNPDKNPAHAFVDLNRTGFKNGQTYEIAPAPGYRNRVDALLLAMFLTAPDLQEMLRRVVAALRAARRFDNGGPAPFVGSIVCPPSADEHRWAVRQLVSPIGIGSDNRLPVAIAEIVSDFRKPAFEELVLLTPDPINEGDDREDSRLPGAPRSRRDAHPHMTDDEYITLQLTDHNRPGPKTARVAARAATLEAAFPALAKTRVSRVREGAATLHQTITVGSRERAETRDASPYRGNQHGGTWRVRGVLRLAARHARPQPLEDAPHLLERVLPSLAGIATPTLQELDDQLIGFRAATLSLEKNKLARPVFGPVDDDDKVNVLETPRGWGEGAWLNRLDRGRYCLAVEFRFGSGYVYALETERREDAFGVPIAIVKRADNARLDQIGLSCFLHFLSQSRSLSLKRPGWSKDESRSGGERDRRTASGRRRLSAWPDFAQFADVRVRRLLHTERRRYTVALAQVLRESAHELSYT